MKGAVRAIVSACGYDEKVALDMEKRIEGLAARGYRTILVAKVDAEGPKLVGLAALYDPPRPDSAQLISELNSMGVSVKMLTGDALPIAKEIAREVGLKENIMRISDLKALKEQSSLEAAEAVEGSSGFAEVYPEDKYFIVRSLQARGHIVGMTGDGVNDAPALRQAEVGIAVSNATDVAKASASVVLTQEGLTNMVDMIKVGRTVFERVKAWIVSKMVRTLQVAAFVVVPFLLTGEYVVSTSALVLYFFATDFVKLAIATDNQRWSTKPTTWNIKNLVKISVVLSSLVIIESLILLYMGINLFGLTTKSGSLYTYSFAVLAYPTMFLILNVRERGHFWNSRPSRALALSMVTSIAAVTLVAMLEVPGLAPLPITTTLLALSITCIFSLALNDFVKVALASGAKISW